MKQNTDSPFYVDFDLVSKSEMANYTNEDLCIITEFSAHKDVHNVRMGALLLIFCQKGSLNVSLNGTEHRLESTEVMICLPSTLLSNAKLSTDFEGGMIFISKQLLGTSISNAYNQLERFFYLSENPVIHLGEAHLQSLSVYFKLMREKIAQGNAPYQKEIISSLMRAGFFELMGCVTPHENNDLSHQPSFSQGERLVRQFLQMLGTDEVKQRFVTDYASRLCVTPKYLSAVCKSVTGRTASHWIDEFVVREARHLLLNTDKTIKEIAQQLGFPNLSFFGKYIKAQLGTSPTNFRMSARQKGT